MTENAEFEPIQVRQTRGPVLAFNGRLLASDEYETRGRDPMSVLLEVFETQGGAYVAVSSFVPAERDGFEDIRASVIEPGPDEVARRCAVLDHFTWDVRARKMLRKQGWKFIVEVA